MTITQLLVKYQASFSPIVSELKNDSVLELDLSRHNQELAKLTPLDTNKLQQYIENQLHVNQKQFAWGGYGEDRMIYEKSEHFETSKEARSVHLGIDIWTPAKLSIQAPTDSIVHSLQNNDQFGDYGPTIILQHSLENQLFFSLYGHLSVKSLEAIKPGQFIAAGQRFAQIGDAHENGNWPPHLHLQLIRNMGNYSGDYPGVCTPSEKKFWLEKCPNPTLLLNI
jgi:hypothetical protein